MNTTNLSSGEAPSNQQPTPDKGKAVVEDEPTRLDPNLAAKMEKARVKEATRRSLEQDPLTVPGFAVNDHGESSGQRSKGNLDSSCPPRPTTEVEKTAEGVHGWIDEMLRNVMIANQERDQIQSRLKQAEEKPLKLTGYQIRGHPYGIASFPDVNLTITEKWTTFPEDIEAFEGNMDAFPELKHAVEVHSGMTVYKTDCSVCGRALGFFATHRFRAYAEAQVSLKLLLEIIRPTSRTMSSMPSTLSSTDVRVLLHRLRARRE
ncbi:hypothetical protein R1sor_002598 [Riccia sorocarpa]|uniref:Uncharacterized protein n=1 Tax=Riccia sorocarpa TaxID=122646 RepID=A0ABD3H0X0_9MARC